MKERELSSPYFQLIEEKGKKRSMLIHLRSFLDDREKKKCLMKGGSFSLMFPIRQSWEERKKRGDPPLLPMFEAGHRGR